MTTLIQAMRGFIKGRPDVAALLIGLGAVVVFVIGAVAVSILQKYGIGPAKVLPKKATDDGDRDVLTFNAAKDFSRAEDYYKTSAWEYGYYTDGLDGSFVRHHADRSYDFEGVQGWHSTKVDSVIGVMRNITDHILYPRPCDNQDWPTFCIPTGVLHMHGGMDTRSGKCFYDVVRWKCPKTAKYQFTGSFDGLDRYGRGTDVYVLRNQKEFILNRTINGYCAGMVSLDEAIGIRTLGHGDTIDFVVGVKSREQFGSNSIALRVTISESNS